LPSAAKRRAGTDYTCRLYRTPILPDEVELLCTSFERSNDRPKMNEAPDRMRVASV
jgi:MarR family transcriptional repressor of emrRAB